MTRTVWKFPLAITLDETELVMPTKAEILHFDLQANRPTIWALVDPTNKEVEKRRFHFVGTGQNIETVDNLQHVGSCLVQEGIFVFHLFEIKGE